MKIIMGDSFPFQHCPGSSGAIFVQREIGDKAVYRSSAWWYAILHALRREGYPYPLCKVTHEQDGNMYGDTYYLRTPRRGKQHPYVQIYDPDYAIRDGVKAYRDGDAIRLLVDIYQ